MSRPPFKSVMRLCSNRVLKLSFSVFDVAVPLFSRTNICSEIRPESLTHTDDPPPAVRPSPSIRVNLTHSLEGLVNGLFSYLTGVVVHPPAIFVSSVFLNDSEDICYFSHRLFEEVFGCLNRRTIVQFSYVRQVISNV